MWSKLGSHLRFLENGKKLLLPAVSQHPDHQQGWFWWQTDCLITYWELNYNFRHGSHLVFLIKCQKLLLSAVSQQPEHLQGRFWWQFQSWWTSYIFEKIANKTAFNSCFSTSRPPTMLVLVQAKFQYQSWQSSWIFFLFSLFPFIQTT